MKLIFLASQEKLENWLTSLKLNIIRKAAQVGPEFRLNATSINEACTKGTLDVAKSMENLLATGNLVSKTGLGLMQVSHKGWYSCE